MTKEDERVTKEREEIKEDEYSNDDKDEASEKETVKHICVIFALPL